MPLAEHDRRDGCRRTADHRFNSRAPRGARHAQSESQSRPAWFQFTCPSRSTTDTVHRYAHSPEVSIHVPLAEHDDKAHPHAHVLIVSIHVPLAEHDSISQIFLSCGVVSIHVPLAEHDMLTLTAHCTCSGFNSRAPRGARRTSNITGQTLTSFNSRAPRGARHGGMRS